jgi:hypothetical protein
MNVNVSGFKPTNKVGDSTNSFNTAATTFQPSSYQGAQQYTGHQQQPAPNISMIHASNQLHHSQEQYSKASD